MKRIFLSAFAVFVLFAATVTCAGAQEQVPTKITSEKMRYEEGGSKVVFEGKVHVTRPDMQLWSRVLTVYLAQEPNKSKKATPVSGEPGKIEKIVAEDDVRMLRDGKEGFCGRATYLAKQDMLIMERSPKLIDGSNSITGRRIKLYLKDNRSEVEGGPSRQVEAVFFTDKADEEGLR